MTITGDDKKAAKEWRHENTPADGLVDHWADKAFLAGVEYERTRPLPSAAERENLVEWLPNDFRKEYYEAQGKLAEETRLHEVYEETAEKLAEKLIVVEARLAEAVKALEKIGIEDEINTNFSDPKDEAQYYIDVAKEFLAKIKGTEKP